MMDRQLKIEWERRPAEQSALVTAPTSHYQATDDDFAPWWFESPSLPMSSR
jgi:hypothetical protein